MGLGATGELVEDETGELVEVTTGEFVVGGVGVGPDPPPSM